MVVSGVEEMWVPTVVSCVVIIAEAAEEWSCRYCVSVLIWFCVGLVSVLGAVAEGCYFEDVAVGADAGDSVGYVCGEA